MNNYAPPVMGDLPAVPVPAPAPVIGREQIDKAADLLTEWSRELEPFRNRIKDEEARYRRERNAATDAATAKRNAAQGVVGGADPSNADGGQLFGAVEGRIADVVEQEPSMVVIPREPSDEQTAETLSMVAPVILNRANFSAAWAEVAEDKTKHGTAFWGVFWDPSKDSGLGEISVQRLPLENVIFEPGKKHIQDSSSLFVVAAWSREALRRAFPEVGTADESPIDVTPFVPDSALHKEDKVLVVDWYYKVYQQGGRTVLHYCKFAAGTVLFASENDPQYADGWYKHGEYPVHADAMFRYSDSPTGFGLIEAGRREQDYIDRLDKSVLQAADEAARTRYFAKKSLGIDLSAYNNLDNRIVEVEGDIDEEKLRRIDAAKIDPAVVAVRERKTEELKETTFSLDVTRGASTGGVTAASAIAALQQAGGKGARRSINGSYTVIKGVFRQIVELIRQFYTTDHLFRVVLPNGMTEWVTLGGGALDTQMVQSAACVYQRRPDFDIEVKASPEGMYSKLAQNELAKELFGAGVFRPDMAQQALLMLEMMDFPGVETVRKKISEQAKQYATALQQMASAQTATEGGGE